MAAGRVLIIDDNVDLAENLREILEDEGFEVETADSGPAGLERLEQTTFDLVVTDMRMPVMSGLEVIRHIKSRWPATPAAVITAYERDEELREAEKAGALGIIPKPLDLEGAVDFVRRVAEGTTPVLVVEDDGDLRANLVAALQEIPGVVPFPADGAAAARALAGQVHPKAAIVDLRLPDGSGVEVGKELESGGKAAVVYVTGFAEDFGEELREVLALPNVHMLEKPFDTDALLDIVRGAT